MNSMRTKNVGKKGTGEKPEIKGHENIPGLLKVLRSGNKLYIANYQSI